jgi:hypothetical protein
MLVFSQRFANRVRSQWPSYVPRHHEPPTCLSFEHFDVPEPREGAVHLRGPCSMRQYLSQPLSSSFRLFWPRSSVHWRELERLGVAELRQVRRGSLRSNVRGVARFACPSPRNAYEPSICFNEAGCCHAFGETSCDRPQGSLPRLVLQHPVHRRLFRVRRLPDNVGPST